MTRARKKLSNRFQSSLFLAKLLFYFNAAWWLLLGIIFVYQMVEDKNSWSSVMVSIFFVVMIASLIVGARIVSEREKWAFVLCIVIAVANILFSIFGFLDFLFVIAALFDLAILGSLFSLKGYYLTS
ncbi:MAG TPA: hypothetical protein PKJ84_02680 [Anaerolineales bacterium]|nr:hypothetical protein [Anaerolineales bacterium]